MAYIVNSGIHLTYADNWFRDRISRRHFDAGFKTGFRGRVLLPDFKTGFYIDLISRPNVETGFWDWISRPNFEAGFPDHLFETSFQDRVLRPSFETGSRDHVLRLRFEIRIRFLRQYFKSPSFETAFQNWYRYRIFAAEKWSNVCKLHVCSD